MLEGMVVACISPPDGESILPLISAGIAGTTWEKNKSIGIASGVRQVRENHELFRQRERAARVRGEGRGFVRD